MIDSLKAKCKFQHAVWFVDINKDELEKQKTATDINIKRTLTHTLLMQIVNFHCQIKKSYVRKKCIAVD